MKALIVGSTGLVGQFVLQSLLENSQISQVVSLSRRSTGIKNSKLTEILSELENISESLLKEKGIKELELALCCLGTTIKKAGSQEKFKAIDYQAVIQFANLAKTIGVKTFGLVSALGADEKSKIFYNQIKGEVERDVISIGFEKCVVIRPSLLLGKREEFRLGEKFAILITPLLSPVFVGPLNRYRPVSARNVARKLVETAINSASLLNKVEVIESENIS